MRASAHLRLAYFGDDFTGSTDALEFLTRAGIKTALFLEPPTSEQLAAHPGVEAIGVAGLTRALAPGAMEAVLRPAFGALRALGAPHVHYKVCSTFDSSPAVGSIGRAIDVGAEIFGRNFVPLLVGAPALGRHCVFGNLFARMGIGSAGEIHRLDRHPAMSRHPVTPATESDLRLHLARQTTKTLGLFDILSLALPPAEARIALDSVIAGGAEVVLFDVLYTAQLAQIGALIDAHASAAEPLFSVGSSGIEMALGAHWAAGGEDFATLLAASAQPGPAGPFLVVSGSCSPVTAGQIDWALAHGFTGIAFDPMGDPGDATEAACAALRAGRNAVVFTSRGAPAGSWLSPHWLGGALGGLAHEVVARTGLKRLLIAGGDTSSYVAREMGIVSVEMIAPLAPGAPLCRAHAPGSPAHGLEVNFKGGQVGAPDYFGAVAAGTL